jgi:phosphodiesterase/alkaline phosphatase D-like protein
LCLQIQIGGGDQIYNDGVRVDGPLKEWTAIANPKKRRDFLFGDELRSRCDDYYFNNYIRWYGTEPFKSANCSIPQLNIWDDHDIIDGFGSYTDHFMRCAVFRGIGGVAHKYGYSSLLPPSI